MTKKTMMLNSLTLVREEDQKIIICSIRKQFFNPFNAKVPLSLPPKIIRKPEVFFREYKGKH